MSSKSTGVSRNVSSYYKNKCALTLNITAVFLNQIIFFLTTPNQRWDEKKSLISYVYRSMYETNNKFFRFTETTVKQKGRQIENIFQIGNVRSEREKMFQGRRWERRFSLFFIHWDSIWNKITINIICMLYPSCF